MLLEKQWKYSVLPKIKTQDFTEPGLKLGLLVQCNFGKGLVFCYSPLNWA